MPTRTHGLPRARRASFRPMRLHVALDDELVHGPDRRAAPPQRSAFIAELIRRGLDNECRWDDIEVAVGGLPNTDHESDYDPAARVQRRRSADPHHTV